MKLRSFAPHRVLLSLLTLLIVPALEPQVLAAAPLGGKIIISGASGQLGEEAVKDLLERGVAARDLILVSRTPDKLADYARQGASVRFGDLTKPESLAAAYAGGTRMLLISIMPGPGISRPEAHKAAIDAAAKDGVKHIVYTSFGNAERSKSPIAIDHARTEASLKASGLHWTILRNNIYAEGLIKSAAQMYVSGRAEVPPDDAGIGYVTRTDCAAAAAAALLSAGDQDRTYDITGPDLIDTPALAKIVQEVTGKPIQAVKVAARSGGLPTADGLDVKTDAVRQLTGRAPTSVRALLEANKPSITAQR